MEKNLIHRASRSAAIVIHDQSVLLMYHKKSSHAYYVFPGGTVNQNEQFETAAVRELFEETSVQGEVIKLLYQINVIEGSTYKEEFFYLCTYVAGKPMITKNSIEAHKMILGTDFYEPQWVSLTDIEKILVYPTEVCNWLIEDIKSNFSDSFKKITVQR